MKNPKPAERISRTQTVASLLVAPPCASKSSIGSNTKLTPRMHSTEKQVRYVMSHNFRVWTLTSPDRLLAHRMMLSSHSTPGGWLCHRGAFHFRSSSSSVRHQTVSAAPGTRCSSARQVLCSRCRTGDMQRRSARAPGGQGPAATGETVHLKGPQSTGRVKPHASWLSPVGWDSNQWDTGSCRCPWSIWSLHNRIDRTARPHLDR